MTLYGYLLGLVILSAAVGPLVAGARAVRRWLLPEWDGALSVLAQAVLTVGALCAMGQALGAASLFRVVPMVAAAALVGGAAVLSARRRMALRVRLATVPDRVLRPVPSHRSRAELLVAGATTTLVTAMWSTWVSRAFTRGIENRDSIWYHLPMAARFVQEGRLSDPHFLNGEALVTYYPANSSLLHSFGILAFGRDDLSLLVNMAGLALCLLAAAAIARRWDAGLVAITGCATALTLPVLAASQPGSAKDDVLTVAFVLAAVAFLVNAEGRPPALALSGAAAGLAIAMKPTALVPVAIVGFGVVVLTRRRNRKPAGAWLAGMLVTGPFWYLRNMFVLGNPVPSVGLRLGPLELPSPETPSLDRFGSPVVEFIGRRDVWGRVFEPGLVDAFGPAWPLVLLLAGAGMTAAVVRGGARERLAGLAGAGMSVSFLFVPGTAFGVGELTQRDVQGTARLIFAYNLRYLMPALVLGFILLAVMAPKAKGAGRWTVLAAFAVLLLLNQTSFSGQRGWATGYGAWTVAIVLGLAAGWALTMAVPKRAGPWSLRLRGLRSHQRWAVIGAAGFVGAATLLAGLPLSRRYHERRYAVQPLATSVRGVHHKRIAIAGFAVQYPLLGDDLSNHVQYIGRRGEHGSFAPLDDCLEWRRALREGTFDYVVTPTNVATPLLGFDLARWQLGRPDGEPPRQPPESAWSRSDPGLRQILEQGGATLYKVGPEVTDGGC